jgi:hypothetical protein
MAVEEKTSPSGSDGGGMLSSEKERNHHSGKLLVSQFGSIFVFTLKLYENRTREDERRE